MIRKIMMLVALVALAHVSNSQGASNSCPPGSSCIPDYMLQNAIIADNNRIRAEKKLAVADSTNKLLAKKVENRDSIIVTYQQKLNVNAQMADVDKRNINNLEKQGALKDQAISKYIKDIKWQKKKTIIVISAIVLAAVANSFLH